MLLDYDIGRYSMEGEFVFPCLLTMSSSIFYALSMESNYTEIRNIEINPFAAELF